MLVQGRARFIVNITNSHSDSGRGSRLLLIFIFSRMRSVSRLFLVFRQSASFITHKIGPEMLMFLAAYEINDENGLLMN
ncbi:MAG: hypothetical protein CMJ66_11860 [Planctomycetaceae bacterium]|nr:hypothetical protein [Planctomycetaceae bacterium]